MTAASNPTTVAVIPTTYALARTTVRLAFRPKSIAAAPRITCATAVASQAIAPRTAPTSLTPTNLTPVVARRGPGLEREFNQPVPVPVTLKTTRPTLMTARRMTNLSQRDPTSDGNIRSPTLLPRTRSIVLIRII